MTILQTKRLNLRPCQPGDCANFIELEQDPAVMLYLNGGQPVDRATVGANTDFLMPTGTEQQVWTAEHLDSGTFVGWFCLWPENDGTAELGYRLRQADWGQGLAAEGASALINWAFTTGQCNRITATTMAVNVASRRVMEKIGMHYVRTVPFEGPDIIPGGEAGEVWYELDLGAWKGF